MGVLSSLLNMAKQHFHTYDHLSDALEGIQKHSDKGETVQTMCEIDDTIVVVFNNTSILGDRPAISRRNIDSSQFADRSPLDGPYS